MPGRIELLALGRSGGYGYLVTGHESWVLGVGIVDLATVLGLGVGFHFRASADP